MWFARYDISESNNHKVHELLELPHLEAALQIVLNENEAISSITHSEAMSFLESRSAAFVDGVFTITTPDLGMVEYGLEDRKRMKLDELRQYTRRFILSSGEGESRYPLDTQASFNRIYSKAERKLRLNAIPDDIKAALAGGSIGIAKVYQWVMGFLERNNVSQDLIDQAEVLKSGYQAGTVTMQQIFQWALAVLADIEAQHNAKIELIDSVNDWIHSVLDRYYSVKTAIDSTQSIEELNALLWDFSDLDSSDPNVWLEHLI